MSEQGPTLDEVYVGMATRSGDMSADDWRDFFAMPEPAQRACARLYKDAIWIARGPSGFDEALDYLGKAAEIAADAAGLKSGLDALRAL